MSIVKSSVQYLIRNYHIAFNKSCCQILFSKNEKDPFDFGDRIQIDNSGTDYKYLGKGYYIKK